MTETTPSFLDRHHLLFRRLHSLLGVVPIGVFLFPHLLTNSSIVWGRWLNQAGHVLPGGASHAGVETFQHEVNFIHNLPFLILIEFGVLFLPIAFHALLGIIFALTGRMNITAYGYGGNWRYTLQRLSGYLGVAFIFTHIISLRFQFDFWGLMPSFVPHEASSSTALHFQAGAWGYVSVLFYLLCVLGLVFHFANGLWTAALTWGLTVSEPAQKRWGYVCTAVGLGLGLAAVMAVTGFATLDADLAQQIESLLAAAGH